MKINLLLTDPVVSASATAISCSKSPDAMPQQDHLELQTLVKSQNISEAGEDRIIFTKVVQLEGSQETPAVVTEPKGIAIPRVSESKKLHSKVIIQKLAERDALRFAHIHTGATGANGPVRISIAGNAADLGINKEFQLTDAQFTFITSGAAYVNAHSNFFPSGIVRGQIR